MEVFLWIISSLLLILGGFLFYALRRALKRIEFFEGHFMSMAQILTFVQGRLDYLDKNTCNFFYLNNTE